MLWIVWWRRSVWDMRPCPTTICLLQGTISLVLSHSKLTKTNYPPWLQSAVNVYRSRFAPAFIFVFSLFSTFIEKSCIKGSGANIGTHLTNKPSKPQKESKASQKEICSSHGRHLSQVSSLPSRYVAPGGDTQNLSIQRLWLCLLPARNGPFDYARRTGPHTRKSRDVWMIKIFQRFIVEAFQEVENQHKGCE